MSGKRIFEKDQTPLLSYTLLTYNRSRVRHTCQMNHLPNFTAVDYKTSEGRSEEVTDQSSLEAMTRMRHRQSTETANDLFRGNNFCTKSSTSSTTHGRYNGPIAVQSIQIEYSFHSVTL